MRKLVFVACVALWFLPTAKGVVYVQTTGGTSAPTSLTCTPDEGRISCTFTDPNSGGADTMQVQHRWNGDADATWYEMIEFDAAVSSPYVNTKVKDGIPYNMRFRLKKTGQNWSAWTEDTNDRPSAFIGLDSYWDVAWNSKRLDTLFTDTSGTTQVTKTSDDIARWNTSVGSNYATQATSADRPQLNADGFLGVWPEDSDYTANDQRNLDLNAAENAGTDNSLLVVFRIDGGGRPNVQKRLLECSNGGACLRLDNARTTLRYITFDGVSTRTSHDITLSPAVPEDTDVAMLLVKDNDTTTVTVYGSWNGGTSVGSDATIPAGDVFEFLRIGNNSSATQASVGDIGYVAHSSSEYSGSQITDIWTEVDKWIAAAPEDHTLTTNEVGIAHIDGLVRRKPDVQVTWDNAVYDLLDEYEDAPWLAQSEVSKAPNPDSDWIVYTQSSQQAHGQDDHAGIIAADSGEIINVLHHKATRATQNYLPAANGNIGNGMNLSGGADKTTFGTGANANTFFAGGFLYSEVTTTLTSAQGASSGIITVDVGSSSAFDAAQSRTFSGCNAGNDTITASGTVVNNSAIVLEGTVCTGLTEGEVYLANGGGSSFSVRDPDTGSTINITGSSGSGTVYYNGSTGNPYIFIGDPDNTFSTTGTTFQYGDHRIIIGKPSGTELKLSGCLWSDCADSYSIGDRIWEHVDAGNPINWSFNQSSSAAKDANGDRFVDAVVTWFSNNAGRDKNGTQQVAYATIMGFYNDVDACAFNFPTNNDLNGDFVRDDHGIDVATLTELQRPGLDALYQGINETLGKIGIAGGADAPAADSCAFDYAHGVQLESYHNSSADQWDDYWVNGEADIWPNIGDFWIENAQGPFTNFLSKSITWTYDNGLPNSHPDITQNDREWRYAVALALASGFGSYTVGLNQQTHDTATDHDDTWHPEFSVITTSGSTYGDARNKTDKANINSNPGWLGKALGPRVNLTHWQDDDGSWETISQWDDSGANELDNDDIDTVGTTGFTCGANCTRTLDTTTFSENTINIVMDTYADPNDASVDLDGPNMSSLTVDEEYVVYSQLGADDYRQIQLNIGETQNSGSGVQEQWVDRDLKWHAHSFYANATTDTYAVNIGGWVNDVYLGHYKFYSGNPHVWRREFANGWVYVNNTLHDVTISLGTRMLVPNFFTQDTAVSDGRVTAPAQDTATDGAVVSPSGYQWDLESPGSNLNAYIVGDRLNISGFADESCNTTVVVVTVNTSTSDYTVENVNQDRRCSTESGASITIDPSFMDIESALGAIPTLAVGDHISINGFNVTDDMDNNGGFIVTQINTANQDYRVSHAQMGRVPTSVTSDTSITIGTEATGYPSAGKLDPIYGGNTIETITLGPLDGIILLKLDGHSHQ